MTDCNSEEIDFIASYLRSTSVSQLGVELANGKYILKKIIIDTVSDLGSLVTLTGVIPDICVIGRKKPIAPTTDIVGEKKYLVKSNCHAWTA